jgi:hypothetical protein
MKKVATMLMLNLLVSCGFNNNNTAEKFQHENTVLVIITDNSKSFVQRCPKITGQVLKPLCDKVSQRSNLDIRVGRVLANSDTEFLRYVKRKEATTENNPWLETETVETPLQRDWQVFANALALQGNQKPTLRSDIGGALSHALLVFQEYPATTRKILILATDYKNNGQPVPKVDSTIEVLSIGALPNVPVENVLHTPNVRRFETLQTTTEYILSTLKN